MNVKIRLGLFAAVLPIALIAHPASAATEISSITVFGDSLVDAGNVFFLTGGAVPSPSQGYFQGRFTDGYNYPDLLSLDLFGQPTVASSTGGANFAFGGARATTTSGVPDLIEQLGLFTASGQSIDPNGLYILNFGGNDIFAALGAGAPAGYASDDAFLRDAAIAYASGVQFLSDLGANNILITGFPVAGPGLSFSIQAEGYLSTELDAVTLSPSSTLLRFNYLDFFQRVTTDPTAFGLPADLDLSTPCLEAPTFPDCTNYFYFDSTHPTSAIQKAAYLDMSRQFQFTAAGPVPEPGTWAMMLLGFGFVGGAMRSARRNQKVAVSYA